MRDQALWPWHLIAGAFLAFLAGSHMIVMHLDSIVGWMNPAGGSAVDWANVAARSKDAAMMVGYILFLAAGLFHAFYGLRNILFELNPGRGMKQFLTAVFVVGGLGLFALGTWAVVTGFLKAQGA